MNADLPKFLDAFAGLRVLVVGDAMLDSYWEGSTGRFCPEAPVPVVTLHGRQDLPGGAANTAANASSLGARVTLLSVLGKDVEGAEFDRALRDWGVAPSDRQTASPAPGPGSRCPAPGTTPGQGPTREGKYLDKNATFFVQNAMSGHYY
jgi:hypothetical protein